MEIFVGGGLPLDDTRRQSSITKLRIVFMTALFPYPGFIPMALASDTVREVK